MPIYEYQCHECQQIFEEWQTSFEDRELECPVCGGNASKVISNSTFVLKGGGWYASGYCKTDQASGNDASADSTTASSGESSGDSGAADSSAAKPPVKESASSTKESGGATT